MRPVLEKYVKSRTNSNGVLMETFESFVLFAHVLIALAITGLILIQHGKGADAGAGFGGGASATVFGAGGPGSFLVRMTALIAVLFFVTSFSLSFFAKQKSSTASNLGVPVLDEGGQNDSMEIEESSSEFETGKETEIPAT